MSKDLDPVYFLRLQGMEDRIGEIANCQSKKETRALREHFRVRFTGGRDISRSSQHLGCHRLLNVGTYPAFDYSPPAAKCWYLVQTGTYGFIAEIEFPQFSIAKSKESFSEIRIQKDRPPILLLDRGSVFQRLERRRKQEDEITGYFQLGNLPTNPQLFNYDSLKIVNLELQSPQSVLQEINFGLK